VRNPANTVEGAPPDRGVRPALPWKTYHPFQRAETPWSRSPNSPRLSLGFPHICYASGSRSTTNCQVHPVLFWTEGRGIVSSYWELQRDRASPQSPRWAPAAARSVGARTAWSAARGQPNQASSQDVEMLGRQPITGWAGEERRRLTKKAGKMRYNEHEDQGCPSVPVVATIGMRWSATAISDLQWVSLSRNDCPATGRRRSPRLLLSTCHRSHR